MGSTVRCCRAIYFLLLSVKQPDFLLLTVIYEIAVSITTHSRYEIKKNGQRKTTEVMLLMKLPSKCEKKAIFLIFVSVSANFLLSAVKCPKILVLAVTPTPHLGPLDGLQNPGLKAPFQQKRNFYQLARQNTKLLFGLRVAAKNKTIQKDICFKDRE